MRATTFGGEPVKRFFEICQWGHLESGCSVVTTFQRTAVQRRVECWAHSCGDWLAAANRVDGIP